MATPMTGSSVSTKKPLIVPKQPPVSQVQTDDVDTATKSVNISPKFNPSIKARNDIEPVIPSARRMMSKDNTKYRLLSNEPNDLVSMNNGEEKMNVSLAASGGISAQSPEKIVSRSFQYNNAFIDSKNRERKQSLLSNSDKQSPTGSNCTVNPKNDSVKNNNDLKRQETPEVGLTPWLRIEKRLNQIRSMASKELHIPRSDHSQEKQIPLGLYSNYNCRYETDDDWKLPTTDPLSYSMLQKLKHKEPERDVKDRWSFLNGFIKPRRRPFTCMSSMSQYYPPINPQDQCELIKLLLACRDLEKVIEEQHTVLDMLDHDLREAQEVLKLPDCLNKFGFDTIAGPGPDPEPFYPTSDIPMFIKGRISLLPKGEIH